MRAFLILFAISLASAQDTSRVFQLHHIDGEKDQYEFATMVRTISETPNIYADVPQKTLSVKGTAIQIATAEFLYTELDRQTVPDSVSQEYKVANNADDIVRLFFLPNTATIQDFQEVATTIRTITEIRRLFTFNSKKALAIRGSADQIAAAAYLVRELDQPATSKRTDSREYRMTDTVMHDDGAVRVFYLPFTSNTQQFQEVATMVRVIGQIRRVFTYNAPQAMIVRGTSDQMALTSWLIKELDKPATSEASQTYTCPDADHDGENLVRVFYVKDAPTAAAFQDVATKIRAATQIRRVFTYNASKAMAVRGTAAQLAMTQQMLEDRARQVALK